MLKVGLIGAGRWGTNYIRTISKMENVQLVWVCTRNSEVDIPNETYLTHKIDDNAYSKVDAIIIATPSDTHYEIAKDALLHSKHVLCEKPLTKSLEQAEELLVYARLNHMILMAGHEYLYNHDVAEIRNIIMRKDINPTSLVFERWSMHHDMDDCLWEMGIHDIYTAMYLLGVNHFDIVYSAGNNNKSMKLIHLKSGEISVSINISSVSNERKRNIIVKGQPHENEIILDEKSLRIYSPSHKQCKEIPLSDKRPLDNECYYFFKAIEDGMQPYVAYNQQTILSTIKLLEQLSK